MKYVPTIGIECHVQLKTKTKLFTSVDNNAKDAEPNTKISELCLGLPGTLPTLNKEAVTLAIRAGHAINAKVNEFSKFDRKHYFYPDLPLGYQITQFDERIIGEGLVEFELDGKTYTVDIEGAHLEADAGKSTHPTGVDYSLVDLNRAGTPLLEIVSKPDIHSAAEAKAYAQELQRLMRFADVSEASLFYGNMRFDVNVSVAPEGSKELGLRAEIKNLNSFKSVEKAAEYEIKRQTKLAEAGEKVVQETRGWDDAKQSTFSQRGKEDAHDYRYFPEADIPPIILTAKEIQDAKDTMPTMPKEVRVKLADCAKPEQVNVLLDSPKLLDLAMAVQIKKPESLKKVINWLTVDLIGLLGDQALEDVILHITAQNLTDLNDLVQQGKISSSGAKSVIEKLMTQAGSTEKVATENNLIQTSDTGAIEKIVQAVITANPKVADQIRAGEDKAIGFLVGQVMKESKGQANPQMTQQIIRDNL